MTDCQIVSASDPDGTIVSQIKVDADEFLVSGSISGDKLSSETRITAGSGSNTAIMSGDPADSHRFWAGSAFGPSANFSVNASGELVARCITIMSEDGSSVWFDSDVGFSELSRPQILNALKSVHYTRIIPHLAGAVKVLAARIQAIEDQL